MSVLHDYAAAVSQPTLPMPDPAEISGMLAATGVTRYDEVVAPDGGLRPAWRSLASAALGLTPEDLGRVDGEIEGDVGTRLLGACAGRQQEAGADHDE